MLAVSLSALLSHWRRRPMQLAMLLLGLSLATALWSGVQAINAEARASYDRAAAMLGQDRLQQIVSADGELMPQSDFVALRRAGWLVSPVIEGDIRFGTVRIHVIGLDPVSLPAEAQQVNVSAGNDLLSFITPPGRMYVAPATATQLAGQPAPPLETASGLPPGTALVDIGIAQSLLDKHGQISRLILDPHQPAGLAPLSSIAPGLVVHAPDPQGDLVRLTDSFHLNLTAFGLLAFAVGLFIVYSAIGLAFEQRRQTFRTLRSLGLSARALIALLLAELLILALVAGLGGVVLGYFVASALLPDVAATLQGLYGAAVPGTLTLRPEWWATGMAIAVLGTLVSSAQSLWQVWRLPLLAPAQPRAWARASEAALKVNRAWRSAFCGRPDAGALGLRSGGRVCGSGRAAAGLGTAFACGHDLDAGDHAAPGTRSPDTMVLGRYPPATARPVAGADGAAAGPVGECRRRHHGREFSPDLHRLARSASGSRTLRHRAQRGRGIGLAHMARPRVDAVLPIWNVEGTVAGRPAQVFGVANDRIYRDNWPMLQAVPDVWDRIAAGNTALINEQMSRRETQGRRPLVLPGNWKTTIVGVYSDYGNPIGQAIVGIDGLTTHYPNVSRLRYGLRLDPAKTPALVDALEAQFHLPSQNVVDQASIKAKSLEIFEKTFAVTGALNVLTLGVAGLAMFASLMTLSGMRLSQIAPVWAMGLTRRHLVALEVARTMVLAVLTLVAALPVGIGLAWVLLAIVNVEAFGWRLPMHLFPSDWLRLAGFALVAALLAALIPLRRLATLSPSDLLKVFANER